jgi:hypothetical protein
MHYFAQVNCPVEWGFVSRRSYSDPFNEVQLDVVFTAPDGSEQRVPAFWAGEQEWRVRFAPSQVGDYRWRTICSDAANASLHGVEGTLTAVPYEGNNPLFRRGRLQVSADGRYLQHRDGTPFLWLGDTWWMGLCKRLRFPGDFAVLTADRVQKGFSVIQIVAGLYPDMGAFDERSANEAGFPWEEGWQRINPRYFDMADLRIWWLVRSGLVPCIVGCWGYYIHWLGVEKMRQHWRYIIARWGAYPVVWCLAGEILMPFYDDHPRPREWHEEYAQKTRAMWEEVARYVREIDPYGHPVTAHPSVSARDSLSDSLLDFDMLQTGHGDRTSLPNTIQQVSRSYHREPVMPVVEGEVCYEGIGEASRQEVQRLMFWACWLNGAKGFTYGANGIWQVNTREKPYGPSPHGMAWGDTPWEEAYQLPGSAQLGMAKRLLERYEWWRIEPHPEWVEPHWSEQNYFLPFAAGIPGELRLIYVPAYQWRVTVKSLEPGTSYRALLFDPATGQEMSLGEGRGDEQGDWTTPVLPKFQDWLLILESRQR